VNFRQIFIKPLGAKRLTLRALKLGELPPGHREFVILSGANGLSLSKKLLSAGDDTVTIDLTPPGAAPANGAAPAPAESPPTFWGFVRLGIAHIWTGYDHMLFLFGLLIVCRTWRSIVTIISCFTIAHSITLALATLNLVNVPSRFTEPAIAASIVFVGAENLIRRGAEPHGRWMLTFAFGLIHGFGFASVLKDLGVGASAGAVAMPLFTFNLGVEIGQIAVASVVLPLVWQLRKREWFVHRGVMVLSAIVAAAGAYWFLQRTVFA
jgi:hydrogenase/urease accessory protein HupE